jgi:hypothetical protein
MFKIRVSLWKKIDIEKRIEVALPICVADVMLVLQSVLPSLTGTISGQYSCRLNKSSVLPTGSHRTTGRRLVDKQYPIIFHI